MSILSNPQTLHLDGRAVKAGTDYRSVFLTIKTYYVMYVQRRHTVNAPYASA